MNAPRLLPKASLVAMLALLGPIGARAQGADRPPLNPLASVPKATLRGFVAQPLFDPSRRPPLIAAPIAIETPPPPPPMAEPPPSLHLLGIVQGAKSVAAIVHRDDTGKTETLHTGDHIGGWEVEVLPLGLRVHNGDRALDYKMFKSGAAASAPEEAPSESVAPTLAAARAARLARPDE